MLQLVQLANLSLLSSIFLKLFLNSSSFHFISFLSHSLCLSETKLFSSREKPRAVWIKIPFIPLLIRRMLFIIITMRAAVTNPNGMHWCRSGNYQTTWKITSSYFIITELIGLSRKLSLAYFVGIMKHSMFGRKLIYCFFPSSWSIVLNFNLDFVFFSGI